MEFKMIKIPHSVKRLLRLPTMTLIETANKITRKHFSQGDFELCSIMNAKSGACSEDCAFCAQSAHYNTNIETYPLISIEKMLSNAKQALDNGAKRIGIVTSGRNLTDEDIETIAKGIRKIKNTYPIEPCCSLGSLSENQFKSLKSAGLTRFHHNLETSENFYANIVSTHKYEERLKTVNIAKKMGFEVCSGGIIGLGESMEDRLAMALELKKLKVDAVPINILIPIPGTPMENNPELSIDEILRTIALYRIILQNKIIKIAAGREHKLKDFQGLAFLAGANGMLIGGYLTVNGRSVEEDLQMLKQLKLIS